MKHILVTPFLLSALLQTALATAAEPVAPKTVIGKTGFGFGAYLPSKCRTITRTLAAKFDSCEWEKVEPSSYTQQADFYTCEITKKGDTYQIFQSMARCRDELGTMNANAP